MARDNVQRTHDFARRNLTVKSRVRSTRLRWLLVSLAGLVIASAFGVRVLGRGDGGPETKPASLPSDLFPTAEQTLPPIDKDDRGKTALTELFQEVRNEDTPIMVERVVNDIDEIVRIVRFNGWQSTHAGEREVRNALRKTLFKYKLHQDQEPFDWAYGYIRTYY